MTKNNLKVNFEIPFGGNEDSSPCIIFSNWIPEGDKYNLIKKYDEVTINLSFDKECVSTLGEVTDEEIEKNTSNHISMLYAEADLGDIEGELTSFIFDERDSGSGKHHGLLPGNKEYECLNSEYKRLGEVVIKAVNETCNRLIAYARNIKGQYWLTTLNADKGDLSNLNNSWRATARINDKGGFRWLPPGTNVLSFELMIYRGELLIKKDEWGEINDFLTSNARPSLVFELMSNTRYLMSQGHRRSAVLEAVSALEVATTTFCKSPNIKDLNVFDYESRIDMENLGNQSKHLGFSGSIRYLIPMLFSSKELSNTTLEKCYQAIDVRNNVVHKGQRNVKKELANEIVSAIIKCCTVLDKHTNKCT